MPFPIKAKSQGQTWELKISLPGPTLLEFLYGADIPIRSSCRGKGTCHQCRVRVISGLSPVSAIDKKVFSKTALELGWRLSCQMRPKSKLEVEFPQIYQMGESLHVLRSPCSEWWLTLDAGTTGMEMVAVDERGVWCRLQSLNHQVTMGADVMTRLELAQRLGVKVLHQRLVEQIKKMVKKIRSQTQAQKYEFLGRGVFSGNSVMTSFLHDWSIENLAVSPFQPLHFESLTIDLGDEGQWTSLPLVHSFVGGDLWAGIFFLWQKGAMAHPDWILMDVGTNSEIIYWTGQELLVTSTPAGPAFEGSNISIGMRAENGALVEPHYRLNQGWSFSVLGGDEPKGICGSTLIEVMSLSLAHGLINREGEIVGAESIRLHADLSLTQADIREFQLAKAAIRAALEVVVLKATGRKSLTMNSTKQEKKLFLAGSFGEHMPIEAARSLGLLPFWPTETIGNSSLLGAIAWSQASDKVKTEFSLWVEKYKKPLELATEDIFQEQFIATMNLYSF